MPLINTQVVNFFVDVAGWDFIEGDLLVASGCLFGQEVGLFVAQDTSMSRDPIDFKGGGFSDVGQQLGDVHGKRARVLYVENFLQSRFAVREEEKFFPQSFVLVNVGESFKDGKSNSKDGSACTIELWLANL